MIRPFLFALTALLAPVAAQDPAVVAIASLSDPAKLATLNGERAANPRLQKIVFWLTDARDRGLAPDAVIAASQRLNADGGPHGAMVGEALLRNLKIADGLGLLTPENREAMRRRRSPTVTRGPYAGEPAEVDHVVPVALAPDLGNEIANLEIMLRTLNRRKGAKMGQRQRDYARKIRGGRDDLGGVAEADFGKTLSTAL